MGFKIRFYRWSGIENGLLVIGIARVELGTVTRSMPEPEEGLYRVVQEIFNEPGNVGPAEIPFLEIVRKMILDSLKDGTPQLRRVADAFGLAPRTLERRLLERFSSILLFLSAKAAHDRREPSLAESSSSAVQEGAQIS